MAGGASFRDGRRGGRGGLGAGLAAAGVRDALGQGGAARGAAGAGAGSAAPSRPGSARGAGGPPATSVTVEGTVELRCAATRTTHVLKGIPLRTGTTFTAGDTGFTIDSVGADRYRSYTRFALSSTTSFENVLSLQLLTADSNKPFS